MDNSSQPRRVWRRNGLKIAATALLIGAWAPGTAQANGTAGLLGLVAGMFGFEKPIDEPVRDAETSRLELRPATGPAPAAAPSRAVDLLAPMRTLLPAPGEWRLVTGTDFDRIRQSDTAATALGVRGSKGSTAVLSNLNGAAYDPGSDSMYFWGGGDTSYGGNEVYQLDMQTLGLSVTANASPLDRTVTGNGGIDCPVPTGGPAASSTYDGIVWSPSTQTFFVFPTTVFCTATSARATSVWEFDPVSGTWSVVTGLGDITGPVFAEYDPATDKIIVVGSGAPATVRTLDPVTGSMTASLSLGRNLASTGGSAVLRPGADDLLLVSQEGVFSVALSPLGTMRALAPLPSDVNPHSGLVYDVGLGVLVLWDGSKTVRTFNPDTLEWTAQTAALGPVSANGDIFSKWVYVDDLGIFAGYHESSEGLWLYRLPLVIGSSPPANTAPIADAGANRTQAVGSRLSLSGANSLDPDGDTLRYYWSVTSRPAGSAAALANPSSSSPSIVPDVLGTYVIQLSVGDGSLSDTDTITITAVNTTPVANAGVNQTLATGQTAFLDGSASFDGNGDPLTYAWTLVSKPAGSGASLSGNTTRTPSIVLDVAGAFLIQLVVNDGIQSGAPDTVTIAATAPVSSAPPPPVASTPPIDPGDLSLLASKLPARGQWALVPNTMFDNVRLRSSDGFPVEGDSRGVLSKWNGMAFDPTNHVMYFYGGGHHGYGGNEVYSMDLETLSLARISNPAPLTDTTTDPEGCNLPATGPAAAHTYSGFVWSPVTKSAFQFSSMNYAVRCSTDKWWGNWLSEFNPVSKTWTRRSGYSDTTSGIDRPLGIPMCGNSTKTNLIYCLDGNQRANLSVYDPASRRMICRSSTKTPRFVRDGAARYHNGYLYWGEQLGLTRLYVDGMTGASCDFTFSQVENVAPPISNFGGPKTGWGFDFAGTTVVAWEGNDRIWTWDMSGGTAWKQLTPPAGSAPTFFRDGRGQIIPSGRIYTKWVYLPELDAFAGYHNNKEGLWLYRLPTARSVVASGGGTPPPAATPPAPSPSTPPTPKPSAPPAPPPSSGSGDANFAARCADPGVVRCYGFDDPTDLPNHTFTSAALSDGSTISPQIDTTTFASGGGAMKLTVPPFSASNTSGGFRMNFTAGTTHGGRDLAYPDQFGEGETFYVQYRQRFDPYQISHRFAGKNQTYSSGFKQSIIGVGDQPGFSIGSCTEFEVVLQNSSQLVNSDGEMVPKMYQGCPGTRYRGGNFYKPVGFDFDVQPDNGCLWHRGQLVSFEPNCFFYKANEWMTFEIQVRIGTWKRNNNLACGTQSRMDDANARGIANPCSEITVWAAREGGVPKKIIHWTLDLPNTNWDGCPSDCKYGKIWLLAYQSHKSSLENTQETYTWYDELVISRNSIPFPN